MNDLYLVLAGYDYEGAEVEGIFTTWEEASAFALTLTRYDYLEIDKWSKKWQSLTDKDSRYVRISTTRMEPAA